MRIGQLMIDPTCALAVVLASAASYLACAGLLRLLGQRTLAALSVGDLACLLAVGAVVGRTAPLAVPTLGGPGSDRESVLLVRDGRCDPAALRRVRVTVDDLPQRLRLAGISRWEQAGRVVLERIGEISVVRRDPGLDEDLFSNTAG